MIIISQVFNMKVIIMLDHLDIFDYYPKNNIYVSPLVNKKVLGKFKHELNGKIITDLIFFFLLKFIAKDFFIPSFMVFTAGHRDYIWSKKGHL